MEGLKIEIGANIQSALTQIVKLTAGVNALGAASAGVGNNLSQIPAALKPINPAAFNALGQAINRVKTDILLQQLRQVAPAANAVSTSLTQVGPSSNRAGQALTDLTRIASDAPFGFIAIQNNIQPMLDSFGRLRKESGSTGAALRSLGTSALGIGGIGIAVAAASFIWIKYGEDIKNALFKTKQATESAKKEAEEYKSAIEGITSSIAGEASRVTVLVQALQGENLSRNQKKAAIEELKKISPEYFGQLEKEKDLVGSLKTAYIAYVGALKKQFEAKALSRQLDTLFDKKLVLDVQLDTKLNTLDDADLNKRRNEIAKQIADLGGFIDVSKGIDLSKITKEQEKILDLQKQLQGLKDIRLFDTTGTAEKLAEVNKQIAGLTLRLAAIAGTEVKGDPGKKEKDALAEQIKQMEALKSATGLTAKEEEKLLALRIQMIERDQSKNNYTDAQALRLIEAEKLKLTEEQVNNYEAISKSVKLLKRDELALLDAKIKVAEGTQLLRGITDTQLQQEIKALIDASAIRAEFPVYLKLIKPEQADIDTTLAANGRPLEVAAFIKPTLLKGDLSEAAKAMQQAAEQFSNTINSTIQSSLVGIAEGIGAALGGAEMQSVLQGFIGLLADGITQIGKAAIAYGVGLLAIKQAFKNPATAIAAGAAMVVVGAAMKQALAARKFATGGIVTGPTNAIIGEGGQPEVIFPLRDLNKFIGNIKGANNGGAGEIVAQGFVEGDHLRLLMIRSNNRFGNSF